MALNFVKGTVAVTSPPGTPILVQGTVGAIPIGIHGTVDIQSDITIGTVNIAGTLTTISAGGNIGTVSTLQSGSVGLLGQPIEVHGTVDLLSDITIGTVNVAGTLTTITAGGNIGTVSTVQSGSVGLLGQPISTSQRFNIVGSSASSLSWAAHGTSATSGYIAPGTVVPYVFVTAKAKADEGGVSSITAVDPIEWGATGWSWDTDVMNLAVMPFGRDNALETHFPIIVGSPGFLIARGSVGISGQPIVVAGTLEILGGTIGRLETIGTVGRVNDIAGTVEISNISAIAGGNIGTVFSVQSGSVGILGQPIVVAGTIELLGGTIGRLERLESQGSVGILSGTVSTFLYGDSGSLALTVRADGAGQGVNNIALVGGLDESIAVVRSLYFDDGKRLLVNVRGTAVVAGTVEVSNISAIAGGNIGTVFSVQSGSVGLLGQPIVVAGTIELLGGTIGRINDIAGTIEISNISAIAGGNIGTVFSVQSGSVGLLGQPISIQGTLNAIATTQSGSVGILGTAFVNSIDYGSIGYTWTRKFLQAVQPEGTIWTPASTKKFNITDLIVSAEAAGTVELRSGNQGTFAILDLAANGGLVSNFKTPIIGSPDGLLTVYLSGGTVNISALGFEN